MSWEGQLLGTIVYFVKFGIGSIIAYAVLRIAIISALEESRFNQEQKSKKS